MARDRILRRCEYGGRSGGLCSRAVSCMAVKFVALRSTLLAVGKLAGTFGTGVFVAALPSGQRRSALHVASVMLSEALVVPLKAGHPSSFSSLDDQHHSRLLPHHQPWRTPRMENLEAGT